MKTKLNTITFAFAITLILPALSYGRTDTIRDYQTEPTPLSPLNGEGTIQCERAGANERECRFTFTDAKTGQSWRIENPGAVRDLKIDEKGQAQVQLEAQKSPRYLLGGSYLVVDRVRPLKDRPNKPSSTIQRCANC